MTNSEKNNPTIKRESINAMLKGIGASGGVAIGQAHLVDRSRVKVVNQYLIDPNQIEQEVERFKEAVDQADLQLHQIIEEIPEEIKDHAGIIDSHRLILRDRMIYDQTLEIIQKEKINAEWALRKAVEHAQEVFAKIKDEYFRGRINDVIYVSERILRNLTGKQVENIADIQGQVIIVAHDLSPADTTQMRLDNVLGFVTDMGGKTSHTAIIAQSLEIPAVVGLERITQEIGSGDWIVVDGTDGQVVLNPDPETLAYYQQKKKQFTEYQIEIAKYSYLPAETRDGFQIKTLANIEFLEELPTVLTQGAEGIGLFRTEFLYLSQKELPSEQTLFESFRNVAQIIAPNPVTIRTLDIGGDKFASHLDLAEEMNPALGLRAIRFCLKEVDIFKRQLRAILRASSYGNLKILFPMISDIDEVFKAKAILNEVKEDLQKEKIPFDSHIPIGIMIEIPSAVTMADLLAREVDFFSIGTNDLIQYALAIDRVNEHVAHMYQPLHPAILRLIQQTVEAGHRAGIPVAMCGEMAGEPLYVPILLGMGLDELSMNPMSIPRIKRIVRMTTLKDSKAFLNQVFSLNTTEEINTYTQQKMAQLFSDSFRTNGTMLY
ncbi:MAG: phosphoenolpyruvate--protein phosphotransferase [Deltaproteobacteria bacterium]|nr:phosphoenolpyruvate--protein phosphotransferase [Deltaproteobacteria bacterium]